MQKVITKVSSILAMLFLVVACSTQGPVAQAPGEPSFPASKKAAVETAIKNWQEKFNAPGVVVGIWTPNEGHYVAAHGVANEATGEPLQPNYHFRIGSISKTFVITVLLQLADEKVINLDDPVSKYLASVPNGKNITLRQMAGMTSGLYNYTADPKFYDILMKQPKRTFKPNELFRIGLSHKPTFTPPGSSVMYSNTNTVMLGVIIEKVTQQPLAKVLEQRIFKPLNLNSTSWPTDSTIPSPYAWGVTEQTVDGKKADATHMNPSWAYAAGNLISNLDDLHVWVKSYTTGSLISPEMQKQRLQWTFPPGNKIKAYGLGIGYFNGWLGHTGELPGYNSGGFYLPESGVLIVLEVNSDIAVNDENPVPALFQEIAKVMTPDDLPY